MRKLNKIAVWCVAALAATFTACDDNTIIGEIGYPEENLTRLFAPIEFEYVTPVTDGFTIKWSNVRGAQGYILQFCADSLFNEGSEEYYAGHPNASRVVISDTLTTSAYEATITGLGLKSKLFIRCAAIAAGVEQSHWLVSEKAYTTLDREVVAMLNAVDRNDVYANEAIVTWKVDLLAANPMDQLIIKVNGEDAETVVALDANMQQAGAYTFTGLAEGTTYLVRGHNSAIEGVFGDYNEVSFKTKSGAGEAIVYDGVENFNELIARVADGSTIFIPAGMTVTCIGAEGNNNNVAITKDLTIRGESSAEKGKATLHFKEMRLYGQLGNVTFENIKFEGEDGWAYVVNLKDDGDNKFLGCDKLSFIDCEFTTYGNAIIRHQGTVGTGLGMISVDNCYVHDINVNGTGNYALFMFKDADYFVEEFSITNTTFYNVGTNIIEHRVTDKVSRVCNATISDCTFQNCGKNTRNMFNFDKSQAGHVAFNRCVFGAIMDPASHKGWKGEYVTTSISQCYATDDFLFASSTGIFAEMPLLGGVAADVFVDAEGGNLSLTGAAAKYAGTIGDPRWY